MRKFEKEYEECYISSSAGDDPLDTEAEFEALLKEHQFKENLAENYASKKFDAIPQHTLLDSSAVRNKVSLNHRKSFHEKKNDLLKTTSILSHNAASPKLSNNLTNSARNSRVTKKLCLNDSSLVSESRGSFPRNESSCDQNEYEDVKVFKKRTKKKNLKKDPEIFVSSVENIEVKYSPGEKETKSVAPVADKSPVSPKAPFERFQNGLFSLFTLCVPWSCMKRVYWKSTPSKQDSLSTARRRDSGRFKRTSGALA